MNFRLCAFSFFYLYVTLTHPHTHSQRTLFISILWRAHCFILRFISGYVFFSALLLLVSDFQWSLPTFNFTIAILLLLLQQQLLLLFAHNYFKRYYKMNIKWKWKWNCESRRWDALFATENFKLQFGFLLNFFPRTFPCHFAILDSFTLFPFSRGCAGSVPSLNEFPYDMWKWRKEKDQRVYVL